jgi:hypothetical protein
MTLKDILLGAAKETHEQIRKGVRDEVVKIVVEVVRSLVDSPTASKKDETKKKEEKDGE